MGRIEIRRRQRLLDDFFKVDEVILRHELSDGRLSRPVRRLNLERGNGVAALLFDRDAGRIILVRQFRYPTSLEGPGWILEVVAGVRDPGESPETTIRREILEETGYEADKLAEICSFYVTPGGSSEQIRLYFAEVSAMQRRGPGGGLAHEGEDIEVVELQESEVWRSLDAGEFMDAKTLVGLLCYRQRRGGL